MQAEGAAGRPPRDVSLAVHPQTAGEEVATDGDTFLAVGPVSSGWGPLVGVEEEELLPESPGLVRGALANGLRFSILRNKVPPKRFYVNLEVHAGSVDEDENQQGLAHFLEHMLFLGSEAYPQSQDIKNVLTKLGMSQLADANAYTDFRSTVYTLSAPTYGTCEETRAREDNPFGARKDTLFRAGLVEAPTTIMTPFAAETNEEEGDEGEEDCQVERGEGGGDNVELVLGLLHQMAFKALLREDDVNSERNAVLNEMRDSTDIDDRVASKYYEHMFNETMLPRRFPIGKEKVVVEATSADLRKFYDTHYHPSNMHLFVVGDINPLHMQRVIEAVFGAEPAQPRAGASQLDQPPYTTPDGPMHGWPVRGTSLPHSFGNAPQVPYAEVRHSQLTSFFLSMTMKEALESNSRNRHMYEELLDSLVGMALDSRSQELRSRVGDPPFLGIDWSYIISPRECCVLNSVTVHGEAGRWKSAVEAAVDIMSSLVKFGLVQTELDRLVATLMRQYELDAEQEDTQESIDVMARLQECAEAGDAYMTPTQRLDLFRRLSPAISLDAVNARAQQLYGFVCHGSRGSSLRHNFVCGPDKDAAGDNFDSIGAARLEEVLRRSSDEALPYEDLVQVPDFLCAEDEVDALVHKCQPKFVPLWDEITSQPGAVVSDGGARVAASSESGLNVTMLRLANGVRVVYKRTPWEKKQVSIELHLLGGRACEGYVDGIKTGALAFAMQAAMESGIGQYSYDAVVRYCQLHDLDYDMRASFEGSTISISASTSEASGLRRAFEIGHLIMRGLKVEPVAWQRLQRVLRVNWEADRKNLESRTARAMLDLLLHPTTEQSADSRFLLPTPDDAEMIHLDDLHRALDVELTPDNLECVIVGDFDEAELEQCVLRYLGTLKGDDTDAAAPLRVWNDEELYAEMFHLATRNRAVRAKVEIPDDTVRSYVSMGFASVNRWGVWEHRRDIWQDFTGGERQLDKRMKDHGNMFVARCMALLTDVINNRLYERVRERGGLVYSVDMMFDPMFYADAGFFTVSLAPLPDKMDVAIDLVKTIIADVQASGITARELEASRRPTIVEVRQNLESNGYWMSLMQGLQSDDTQPKTLDSVSNIVDKYQDLTLEDVSGVARCVLKDFERRLVVSSGLSGKDYKDVSVTNDGPKVRTVL